MIRQITVVGVGLIGGSFALDLKRAGLVDKVVGVGRSEANLERAQQLGVIDVAMPVEEAVKDADLILVSTPVGQMARVFGTIATHAKADAIITDAGSTKADVAALYRQYLAERLAYCLPAHPIAGTEQSGAAAARYGLYQHRKVVLCPLAQTTAQTIAAVEALWQACGAEIYYLDVQVHDEVLASVSHLPHLLAFAYMVALSRKPNVDDCLNLAATGFRDFTRIAGSSPEMWRDVALGNRETLLQQIRHYQDTLAQLYDTLALQEGESLLTFIETAQTVRRDWEKKHVRGQAGYREP